MKYSQLGNTDMRISMVSYGGIVSSGIYGGVHYPAEGQEASDRYVSWAIDKGVNYFDVAPGYGNAQEQLGKSLEPFRDRVFLACKTGCRDKAGAEKELFDSLSKLKTDAFDVYQLHGISSMEEVDRAFGPGGVMELMAGLRDRGIARYIGFTAHNEDAALRMLELFPFDTVLFPFNWFMHMERGMGDRLLKALREKGAGILAMKAFIERRWEDGEDHGRFPKSWCKPIDTAADPDWGVAAMNYALSLGAETLVPPGNFESFSFAVEHIDSCSGKPDMALLRDRLDKVRGKEFF